MSLYVSMSCTDSLYKGRARGGAAASGLAMGDDQGGGGGERARECGPARAAPVAGWMARWVVVVAGRVHRWSLN